MEVTTAFWIGEWQVEPLRHRLSREAQAVVVEPKVMEVLVYLAVRPGAVVTRTELLEAVWPDTVVTDHAVTRCISELRKALQDSREAPEFIETIPKRGYRLLAPVRPVQQPEEYLGDGVTGDGQGTQVEVQLGASLTQEPTAPPVRSWQLLLLILVAVGLGAGGAAVWLAGGAASTTPIQVRPVTSAIGIEWRPALSPDGKRVAYTRAPAPGERTQVFLSEIGTGTSVQLTRGESNVQDPVWSPDGRAVAFRRPFGEACGIYVISALGDNERRLRACTAYERDHPRGGLGLAWTPDGHALVFPARLAAGQPLQLHRLDLATLETTPLSLPDDPRVADQLPRVSPDGKYVAFLRNQQAAIGDLYLQPLVAGATPRRLTHEHGYIAALAWTPDSEHLLISSNRSGNFRYWQVPIAGGEPTWVSSLSTYDPGHLDVQGTQVAYEEWDYEINIYQVGPEAEDGLRQQVASTQWDLHPAWSPDGRSIAFVSNRTGQFALWRAAADGSASLALAAFEEGFVGRPSWSADGERLLFEVRRGGHTTVYQMDARGGRAEPLLELEGLVHGPRWTPDEQAIVVAQQDLSGLWNLWQYPLGGGMPIQRTQEGGYYAQFSTDGQWMYFSRFRRGGLFRQPREGGVVEAVIGADELSHWGYWTLDAESLYLLWGEGDQLEILAQNLRNGARQVVQRFTPPGNIGYEPTLSVSKDGAFLLSMTTRIESDILIAEGFQLND